MNSACNLIDLLLGDRLLLEERCAVDEFYNDKGSCLGFDDIEDTRDVWNVTIPPAISVAVNCMCVASVMYLFQLIKDKLVYTSLYQG